MLRTIRTGVAFALLVGASFAGHAAGLGKLTVSSALGQVLAAEVDLVSVQPGELDSISARVASPENYRDARIEYSSVLRLLRFSVEKRASGQPYLKVTSVAPINEPFVDVLIEVTWPAGRLQREYPILLDPPGFSAAKAAMPAAMPVAAADSAPQAVATAVAPEPMPAPAGTPSATKEMAAAAPEASPGTPSTRDSYGPVEKGETLSKIAGEVKPSALSMEQMLVALYRENKAAFINNNMNLLKAGQILRVPSAEEVSKISGKEANAEYRSHVSNWKTYREGLAGGVAGMPARGESARAASGQVGAAAVSPPPPVSALPKDVLKLSKTDGAKGAAGAGKAGGGSQDRLIALQEEITAKDKALSESQSRVADLEKQIRDMQRLVDLKGAGPAKAGAPAKTADTKVAAAPKPVEVPKPVEAPKADGTPVPAAADTNVAVTKPAEAPAVAPPPKPTEAAKPPAPKKSAPPPPEPDLMDQLLDKPELVAGGVGVVGLLGLGGFLFVRNRRRKADAGPSSSMTSAFPSDLKPNTVTGKAGGGLVDTGNSSFLTDFDKTGPGSIDTDEVDPVAEAEVYIAYGRDAQAEEILKEAMARDKNRHEIGLKLLEIYHARKSATAFETVAKDLRAAVGESSAIWHKAAAMGVQIDPTNPLYGAGTSEVAAPAAFEAATPAPRPDLDFDLDPSSSAQNASASSSSSSSSFDLDLDAGKSASSDLAVSGNVPALDFDLAPSAPASDEGSSGQASGADKPAFDFDLSGLDFPSSSASGADSSSAAPDLNLGDGNSDAAPGASPGLADLDLGEGGDAGGGDAVTTKLELAKAYLEIGDKDGAREILQEVAKEGSAAQIAEAQKLIASL